MKGIKKTKTLLKKTFYRTKGVALLEALVVCSIGLLTINIILKFMESNINIGLQQKRDYLHHVSLVDCFLIIRKEIPLMLVNQSLSSLNIDCITSSLGDEVCELINKYEIELIINNKCQNTGQKYMAENLKNLQTISEMPKPSTESNRLGFFMKKNDEYFHDSTNAVFIYSKKYNFGLLVPAVWLKQKLQEKNKK